MRVLAVDYGARRIGVAVSDPGGTIAAALPALESRGQAEDARAVAEAARREGAERIVVGLPLRLDGALGPSAEKVLAFVEKLRAAVAVPVETWDERLTTAQAERALRAARIHLARDRRRDRINTMAAQILLQSYLDAGKRAPPADTGDRG
jgi:putative Holliday junction resolvase